LPINKQKLIYDKLNDLYEKSPDDYKNSVDAIVKLFDKGLTVNSDGYIEKTFENFNLIKDAVQKLKPNNISDVAKAWNQIFHTDFDLVKELLERVNSSPNGKDDKVLKLILSLTKEDYDLMQSFKDFRVWKYDLGLRPLAQSVLERWEDLKNNKSFLDLLTNQNNIMSAFFYNIAEYDRKVREEKAKLIMTKDFDMLEHYHKQILALSKDKNIEPILEQSARLNSKQRLNSRGLNDDERQTLEENKQKLTEYIRSYLKMPENPSQQDLEAVNMMFNLLVNSKRDEQNFKY